MAHFCWYNVASWEEREKNENGDNSLCCFSYLCSLGDKKEKGDQSKDNVSRFVKKWFQENLNQCFFFFIYLLLFYSSCQANCSIQFGQASIVEKGWKKSWKKWQNLIHSHLPNIQFVLNKKWMKDKQVNKQKKINADKKKNMEEKNNILVYYSFDSKTWRSNALLALTLYCY